MKLSRIITNKHVDKDFDGNDCLLMRTIERTTKIGNSKYYYIRTDRCNYVDDEVTIQNEPTISESGEVIVSEPTTKMVKKLVVISKKDSVQTKIIKRDEYNMAYSQVKLLASLSGNELWEFEEKLEELALLTLTKMSKIFHTVENDWVIFDNESDWVKDVVD